MKGKNLEADNNRIVWGEDCRGVRHFDCVGFVNFVLNVTTGQQWTFNISQYGAGITSATSVPLDSPPEDGDILVLGTEHIGFCVPTAKSFRRKTMPPVCTPTKLIRPRRTKMARSNQTGLEGLGSPPKLLTRPELPAGAPEAKISVIYSKRICWGYRLGRGSEASRKS